MDVSAGSGDDVPGGGGVDAQELRRRHFGVFYGLEPVPGGAPLVLVHGNCQAESLRLALAGDDVSTVQVPPVHELCGPDLVHLDRLLRHTSVLISQPVRDGYRGLPLGWRELSARLGPRGRVLAVPVIRFAGLYPSQAIIRPPQDPALVPPLIPYYDLRTLAQAAGRPVRREFTREAVLGIAALSREALTRREAAHGAVVVSDLFDQPDFGLMRTINHPGNPIWEILAGRVRHALGLAPARALTRPVLNMIHAPREAAVIEAWGLHEAPRAEWILAGRSVDPQEVHARHLDFLHRHPEVVRAGLDRHGAALELLGA